MRMMEIKIVAPITQTHRIVVRVSSVNDYEVGDTFSIDGVTYTVADRKMLDEALKNGEDLTKYCTSKVTDMVICFIVLILQPRYWQLGCE